MWQPRIAGFAKTSADYPPTHVAPLSAFAYVERSQPVSTYRLVWLNKEIIAREEKYDGYYCIITSETNLADGEIVDIYKGLRRIEEAFKITKSDLTTHLYMDRPRKKDAALQDKISVSPSQNSK